MQTLTPEQRRNWSVDGYLLIEGALSPDEVAFFADNIDEIRKCPGYEPLLGMLPFGHYSWVEQCADQNPEAFMDRRDLLSYDQAFIDLIDRAPVFDLIVDIMGRTLPSACRRQSCGPPATGSRVSPIPTAARDSATCG